MGMDSELKFHMLGKIARGETYGWGLRRWLKDVLHLHVNVPTFYRTLQRLEVEGCITCREVSVGALNDGPRRRHRTRVYASVTPKGLAELLALTGEMQSLMDRLQRSMAADAASNVAQSKGTSLPEEA